MKEVICSHCGQTIHDSNTRCPVCGTVIENQPQPVHNTAQKRFIVGFVLLTIFCFVMALWLPR